MPMNNTDIVVELLKILCEQDLISEQERDQAIALAKAQQDS